VLAFRVRMTWLFLAVVCAATAAGCGSASTGQVSPDAVINTVESFAGPNAEVSQSQVLVTDADSGNRRWIPVFVACKPEGGCEVITPDGAGYPDLQAFVDDSKLIKSGDRVLGNVNMTSPGEPVRTETFTKRAVLPWAWYVGGGALLVLLLVVAVWLATRTRRRRVEE
jgi:hypothetical protein